MENMENKLKKSDVSKVEKELQKETAEFKAKIFSFENGEFDQDAEAHAKLEKELLDSSLEAAENNARYEKLRVKTKELEREFREKEALAKANELSLLEEQAKKQANLSDVELKHAEEFIKKAYHIKEAKDRLNNAIESKRDQFKTQQIELSQHVINKLESDRKMAGDNTHKILDRIRLQKEFVYHRYEKDKRMTAEMKEKADQRAQELTQSINLLEQQKKALANTNDIHLNSLMKKNESDKD